MSISRRSALAAIASPVLAAPAAVRRETFLKSPGKGTAVMAYAFYTRPTGGEMLSIEQRWSRSDTIDVAYMRRSTNHGRTWTPPQERKTGERRPNGMLRRHPRAGWVDKVSKRYVEFWNEGILPTDDPLEGMRQWRLYYRYSSDGGVTFSPTYEVVHEGKEFSPDHPMPGVRIGQNCVMLGDQTSIAVNAPDGHIVLPIQLSSVDANGKPYNPGGGYTWTDVAALHAQWKGDRLSWTMSKVLRGDPARTTRGLVEPTIEYLSDGRLLMVMRGSNDKKPALPSHRWASFSSDGGMTWTEPKYWTYDDGEAFYSPSSCSQLLQHPNGKVYWLGNLTPTNPNGNRPRYPFVIGEVDGRTGLLIKSTVRTVDDRQPGESEILTLSNFFAREDRETGGIALHMTRLFALSDGWEGDAMLYRIPV